jgi:hypothetical protein
MSSLFDHSRQVDLLVVGGGGQGAKSGNVDGSSTTNRGHGGGGGAGGAVLEYKDVWVTGDLNVAIGEGGGTVNRVYGYISVNCDGGETSVSAVNTGPFSGVYTAPGGESGGFSLQGGHAYYVSDIAPNHYPFFSAALVNERKRDYFVTGDTIICTRYNAVHTSINKFKYQMKNFVGTPLERYNYGLSIFSPPMFDYVPYGPGNQIFNLVTYDNQMQKNPGRGNYNGSTGGFGGGLFSSDPYNYSDYSVSINLANINYPGQNGSVFADGYSTNKTAHAYGAGGGGGACGDNVTGGTGFHGAGSGASATSNASSALPNTGGGGGGGHPSLVNSGNGGSGLVVISWYE